jgi:hypothetical protein
MNHPHDDGVHPMRYRWEKHVLLDRRVSSHSRLRIFCMPPNPTRGARDRTDRSCTTGRYTGAGSARTCKYHSPVIDLDGLADIPSVRSVVSSTTVQVRRELLQLRELLFIESPLMPDALSMDSLTGLESLYAAGAHSDVRIALDCLPAHSLRQLSIPRWATQV